MAVSGFVYYCPDLQIYRYYIKDTSLPPNECEQDMKFTDSELEDTLAAQLATEEEKNVSHAKFVSHMTGLGRVNPHKVVEFDTETDNIVVTEPAEFWKKQDAIREQTGDQADDKVG